MSMDDVSVTAQEFRSAAFLRTHMRSVMAFYDSRATDPSGGLYQLFLSDGTVTSPHTRHLVNAARYVVTYSMLYRATQDREYQLGVERAVTYLRETFRDPLSGGYAWIVDWRQGRAEVRDPTRHAY